MNHCKNNAITTEVKDDCLQMLNHMFTKQKALIANSSDNMLTNQTKMCRLREEEALKIESWIYFAFNLKNLCFYFK